EGGLGLGVLAGGDRRPGFLQGDPSVEARGQGAVLGALVAGFLVAGPGLGEVAGRLGIGALGAEVDSRGAPRGERGEGEGAGREEGAPVQGDLGAGFVGLGTSAIFASPDSKARRLRASRSVVRAGSAICRRSRRNRFSLFFRTW